jgi:hypothetical protein
MMRTIASRWESARGFRKLSGQVSWLQAVDILDRSPGRYGAGWRGMSGTATTGPWIGGVDGVTPGETAGHVTCGEATAPRTVRTLTRRAIAA